MERPDPTRFRRLTRDLYVPVGEVGFWQGALREPDDPLYTAVEKAARSNQALAVDLLYGDAEGGQRMITRMVLRRSSGEDGSWLASIGRHWHLDRRAPG